MIRLMGKYGKTKWFGLVLAAIMLVTTAIPQALVPRVEAAAADHVVLSQIYNAGGNVGAIYNTKFFELYNPTDHDVDLTGWSLQYAARTGNFKTGNNLQPLSGIIKPRSYFLITGTEGNKGGQPLPISPDIASNINPSQNYGKLALARKTEPVEGKGDPAVVDFVAWADSSSNMPNEYWGSNPIIAPESSPDYDGYVGVEAFKKGTLLRKTNDGGDPRKGTGAGNGWFTRDASADFVIHIASDPLDPDKNIRIRNSQSASEPVLVSPAPDASGIRFAYDDSVAKDTVTRIVYGEPPYNAEVNIYVLDGAEYRQVASGATDEEGHFQIELPESGIYNTVYITYKVPDRAESRFVRIDRAGYDPSEDVIDIAEIRVNDRNGIPVNLDAAVMIRGVVTVDNHVFGDDRFFIQDDTGGVLIAGVSDDVYGQYIRQGNELLIAGKVGFADGMTLVVPRTIAKESEQPMPAPFHATISDLNDYAVAEPLEGRLTTVRGKVSGVTAAGANHIVTIVAEDGKSAVVKVFGGTHIDAVQQLKINKSYLFTGIVGQHKTFAPYDSGYEIYPRSPADLVGYLELQHEPVERGYTDLDLAFAAKAFNAESVTFYYRGIDGSSYSVIPMESSATDQYVALLPKSQIPGNVFEYYIEATAGAQIANAGTASDPIRVTLEEDREGPVFSEEMPADGSRTENKRPEISVKVFDPSGIDDASIEAKLNDARVSADYDPETGRINIRTEGDLTVGTYRVDMSVKDRKGNEGKFSWTFEAVKTFAGGQHYRGSTHNHTSISHDGHGSLESAIEAARYHRYDWFAFTDHSHDIDAASRDQDSVDHRGMPERTGNMNPETSMWQRLKKVADASTKDGEFVAFRSYEMTSTVWGHSNVFGTENFIDRIQDGGIYQNLNNFYKWAKTHDYDLVAQFNHPNWGGSGPPFNSFIPYDPDVDKLFTMFEVGNGSGQYTYSNIEDLYFNTLDKGWHVAPTFGEDHHNAVWGQTMRRTIIVAEDLTREALLDSMRNMRVYMSESPHFTLDVQANGYYMGSVVDSRQLHFSIKGGDSGEAYTYVPEGFQPDERIKTVELITNGGKIYDAITPGRNSANFAKDGKSFAWNPEVKADGGQQWFLVKVTQMDGSRTYSAPIWTKEVDVDVKLQNIEVTGGSIIVGNPVNLQAVVSNLGKRDAGNLTVKMYYDAVDEAHWIGEASIESLPAKNVANVTIAWDNPQGGDRKLIAVIANPPTGNAAENNLFELPVHVKEPLGITVMIDAAHGNENSSSDPGKYKDELKRMTKILRDEGYTVVENKNPLTESLLRDVGVLMISHPSQNSRLTEEEIAAVAAFVRSGGSLLVTAKSNNSSDPTLNNILLEKIGSEIRVNHDGVFDESPEGNFWLEPAVSPWAVRSHPEPADHYVTDFVRELDYYSGASLIKVDKQPLTEDDSVAILARGNATTYQNNIKSGGIAYDTSSEAGGAVIPLIASQQIGEGRVLVSGMNVFNDRQVGNKNQNDRFTRNAFNWLAKRGTVVLPIAEARKLPEGTDIVVQGKATSAAGVFFDAFYIQDDTGGIMAFNEVPKDAVQLGDTVRIYGHVKIFENNLEIMFDNFENNVLKLNKTPGEPLQPRTIKTGEARDEDKQGLLVKLKGVVKEIKRIPDRTFIIDDGSGEALIFIDGYIAEQSGEPPALQVGDTLEAVGLAGKFQGGYWIRVRDTRELIKTDSGPTDPGNKPGDSSGGGNPVWGVPVGDSGKGNVTQPKPDPGQNRDVSRSITADDINNNRANGGQVTISVEDRITEITMPVETSELLAGHPLAIRSNKWAIVLPAGTLKALSELIAEEDRDGVVIKLFVTPIEDWKKKFDSHPTGVTLTGSMYDLQLFAVKKNGDKVALPRLDQPVTLGLKADRSLNPRLVGLYRADERGRLDYIGGKLENGYIAADISGLGQYGALEYKKTFADVPPSHWALETIQQLAAKRIVQGVSETAFEPNRAVTRAEFAALLAGALHLNTPGDVLFTDVGSDQWYAKPVSYAVQAGIVSGKSEKTFAPDDAITRQEMAAMIIRAYEAMTGTKAETKAPAPFKDNAEAAPWAETYIRTAYGLGLIQGRGADLFAPRETTTRAEAAQVVAGLLNL
ncbi:hypothetical protein PAE9249_04842 [Paenibacillus sp. CECT 9249]|uniref:DUF4350 domain-containing protein n=1 Tax=Paenibacillus sp. CECT 9249 TaxID=2845385 RepID=UPI001E3351A9|nr:DUF4350 domain-containing protein [Paenibacillus sp. CECT 9249]CAH0122294.1 hypothetical protein PAE9249_04842 [Paenibacillus sp. CECT 9249]